MFLRHSLTIWISISFQHFCPFSWWSNHDTSLDTGNENDNPMLPFIDHFAATESMLSSEIYLSETDNSENNPKPPVTDHFAATDNMQSSETNLSETENLETAPVDFISHNEFCSENLVTNPKEKGSDAEINICGNEISGSPV